MVTSSIGVPGTDRVDPIAPAEDPSGAKLAREKVPAAIAPLGKDIVSTDDPRAFYRT